MNAPRTDTAESSAAKPNDPSIVRLVPSDQRPPHWRLPVTPAAAVLSAKGAPSPKKPVWPRVTEGCPAKPPSGSGTGSPRRLSCGRRSRRRAARRPGISSPPRSRREGRPRLPRRWPRPPGMRERTRRAGSTDSWPRTGRPLPPRPISLHFVGVARQVRLDAGEQAGEGGESEAPARRGEGLSARRNAHRRISRARDCRHPRHTPDRAKRRTVVRRGTGRDRPLWLQSPKPSSARRREWSPASCSPDPSCANARSSFPRP